MSFDVSQLRIEPVSETSLIIYFADQISEETAILIGNSCSYIQSKSYNWLIEIVPSYTSLFIQYDVLKLDFLAVRQKLESLFKTMSVSVLESEGQGNLIELPACYHPDVAPTWNPRRPDLILALRN